MRHPLGSVTGDDWAGASMNIILTFTVSVVLSIILNMLST